VYCSDVRQLDEMVYKLVEGTRYRMAKDEGLESERSSGELLEGRSDGR
jgi:hypothetical protein